MSVAAVIPCRNAAAYLGEAIASVRAQTAPVDELIVVDDHSTDGSAQVARAGGAITLAAPAPGGPSAARNAGWRHARSDLIAFLDADDRWLPHHIATVGGLLDAHPEAVLAFGGIELFGLTTGRYAQHLPPSDGPVDARIPAALDCIAPQMAVIVRRSALEAVGGYDETLACVQDFELFARLSRQGPFISAQPVTAEYRQHPSQLTRARHLELLLESVKVRRMNLDAIRSEVSPDGVAFVERRVREKWDGLLRETWRDGNRIAFDAVLAMHAQVSGADALAARWRRRAAVGWYPWYAALTLARALHVRQVWNATTGRMTRSGP